MVSVTLTKDYRIVLALTMLTMRSRTKNRFYEMLFCMNNQIMYQSQFNLCFFPSSKLCHRNDIDDREIWSRWIAQYVMTNNNGLNDVNHDGMMITWSRWLYLKWLSFIAHYIIMIIQSLIILDVKNCNKVCYVPRGIFIYLYYFEIIAFYFNFPKISPRDLGARQKKSGWAIGIPSSYR